MRVGIGYDSHQFTDGDSLHIGGVEISHTHGVKAHSDGDVLLHALVDALLGAAALGDIGTHFPDDDPRYKNNSSSDFVLHAIDLLKQQNLQLNNLDATIITESPRLKEHILAIRTHIADLFQVPMTEVSVKATTNEKMGWIGRQEGLAAMVVVSVKTL